MRNATQNHLDAWKKVLASFSKPGAPDTLEAARKAQKSLASADTVLIDMGKSTTCPAFDGSKIGGVDPNGVPVFDPCYCAGYCEDIVRSTQVHEQKHSDITTGLAARMIPVYIGRKIMGKDGGYLALTLTKSEIEAHQAQLDYLDKIIDAWVSERACTWTPVVPLSIRAEAPPPATFVGRLRALWDAAAHQAP